MLEEGSALTLARALEIAAQCERVEQQMAAMRVSSTTDTKGTETVNQISKGKWDKRSQKCDGGKKEKRKCA